MTVRLGGRIDLHIHSNYSDGVLSPEELIEEAIWHGLAAVALTDHDNIDGLAPFTAAGRSKGIETVAGVELSCEQDGTEVHILGLLIEPDDTLERSLSLLRDDREDRMRRMIERLEGMDIRVSYDALGVAPGKAVGRPHLAQALVRQGVVRDIGEAFEKLIGDHGPAYVDKRRLQVGEAIRLIHGARGMAVLAHPAIGDLISRIGEMAALGIDGVEQFYPKHDDATETRIADLCRRYELVPCGGSDYHGNGHGTALGGVKVSYQVLENLKKRKAERWR